MRPLICLLLALCLLLPVSMARADGLVDSITRQLRAQGYDRIETESTLLGRTRIEARSPNWDREIIVNPRTGEILRDYSERRSSGSGRSTDNARPGLLDTDDDDDDGQSKGRGRGRNGDSDRSDDGKTSGKDSGKDSDSDSDSDSDGDSDSDSGGDD